MVADSLVGTLDTLAALDLIHARARLSIEYRMSEPHFNQEGRLVLRNARHPLLEALFRSDPAIAVAPPRHATTAADAIPSPTSDAETAEGPGELSSLPLVDSPPPSAVAEPKVVTPIDVNLGLRFRILVVTGPNTAARRSRSRRSAYWRSWRSRACTCRPATARSFRSSMTS